MWTESQMAPCHVFKKGNQVYKLYDTYDDSLNWFLVQKHYVMDIAPLPGPPLLPHNTASCITGYGSTLSILSLSASSNPSGQIARSRDTACTGSKCHGICILPTHLEIQFLLSVSSSSDFTAPTHDKTKLYTK